MTAAILDVDRTISVSGFNNMNEILVCSISGDQFDLESE